MKISKVLKTLKIIAFLFVMFSFNALSLYKTKTYRRILKQEADDLNPAKLVVTTSIHLMTQIGKGLVTFHNNQLVPALATRWEISKDLKTYTFHLRKNLKFSDGSEITAQNVLRSFKNISSKDSLVLKDILLIQGVSEFNKGLSKEITGIIVVNPYTVKFILKAPYSPFINLLTSKNFVILSDDAIRKLKKCKVCSFPSSGAYQIEKVNYNRKKVSSIILSRNKHYYNDQSTYFDRVRYDIILNKNEARAGFDIGKYHDIWPYDLSNSQIENHLKTIKKIPTYTTFTWFVGINTRNKFLKDIKFRKFISSNLSYDKFISSMKLPPHYNGSSFIPRGLLGYKNRPRVNYNIDIDSILKKNHCSLEKPCNLDLIYFAEISPNIKILFKSINNFSNFLNINLIKLNFENWITRFKNHNYDLYYVGQNASFPEPYSFLSILLNKKLFPFINTNKIEKHMSSILKTSNTMKRRALYQMIDKDLLGQHTIIPIYHGDRPFRYVKKHITGYNISILGYPYLDISYLKEVSDE